jgi:predicted nucleic acid-binding protein
MILYLDTSALVKRYFREPFSDDIIDRWKSANQIVTSFVAYAETVASIYRKKREEDLGDTLVRKIKDSFQQDWMTFIRVEINDELNMYIDHVISQHQLRGFDAIHLASAIVIQENIPDDFLFACFNDQLARAARLEDLETFPQEENGGRELN